MRCCEKCHTGCDKNASNKSYDACAAYDERSPHAPRLYTIYPLNNSVGTLNPAAVPLSTNSIYLGVTYDLFWVRLSEAMAVSLCQQSPPRCCIL